MHCITQIVGAQHDGTIYKIIYYPRIKQINANFLPISEKKTDHETSIMILYDLRIIILT